MIKAIVLSAVTGLTLAGAAPSAQQYAWWPRSEPIKTFSEVLGKVQARPDYRAYAEARYDREARDYRITYVTSNGETRHVVIDAVTGEPRR